LRLELEGILDFSRFLGTVPEVSWRKESVIVVRVRPIVVLCFCLPVKSVGFCIYLFGEADMCPNRAFFSAQPKTFVAPEADKEQKACQTEAGGENWEHQENKSWNYHNAQNS
jgi:hypothetical protein